MSEHAMVPRDGFMVPLIGVPKEAGEETCDACQESCPVSEMQFGMDGYVCKSCLREHSQEFGMK